MAPKVLVTRPLPEARHFAKALTLIGTDPIILPLTQIHYIPLTIPPFPRPDAVILTSAHGLESVKNIPEDWQTIPLFCVGNRTKIAAAELGFQNINVASSGAIELADMINAHFQKPSRFIYFRGHDVEHDMTRLLSFHNVSEFTTYEAQKIPDMALSFSAAIHHADIITLFSRRAAGILCELMVEAGMMERAADIIVLCLSPSVVESASDIKWKKMYAASNPSQDGMIEKLRSILT